MTTPAQSNLSGSASKQPDAGFEASGLSAEEAERLAAAFKPSWEFDEAPFAPLANGAIHAAQLDELGAVEADARTVAPHAPPQRIETHEPEVSVIIDRSITAAEMDVLRQAPPPQASRPPPPAVAVAVPFAAPFGGPPQPAPQRVAPVMRLPRSADESLELPASLKKSNKGLFIGLGIAVAAAALVLVIHGAMSSSSDAPETPTAPPPPVATSAPTAEAPHAASPVVPPPVANPPPTPVAAPTPVTPPAAVVAAAPAARPAVLATPKAQPHPAPAPPPPVHHAAPRNPPKPAAGGIVRDVPF
jgi:hypothetical protein